MVWGVLLFAARAWTQLTTAILLLWSARILTPTDVGIFSLASALTMVLSQWVGVGTYEYIIRERNDLDTVPTALWTNVLVAVGMSMVGFALAFGSQYWFHSKTLPWIVASLAPLTVPAGVRSAMEALMVREARLRSLAACTLIVETLALTAGVVALYQGLGLWSLVVHKWTQILSEAVTYKVASRWKVRFAWSPSTARAMFHFGHGIFSDRVLGYFQTYGVDFVLGVCLNPAAVAIYRVGARLVISMTTVAIEPMRQINWKRLSDAAHLGESVAHVAEDRIVWMAGILWGPLLGLVAVADLLVLVVLGRPWAGSVWVVRLLAIAAMVGVVSLMTESTLGALGKTRWLPLFRLFSLASMLSMLALFVRFGPTGAAASQVAAAILMLGFNIVMQRRIAGVSLWRYGLRVLSVGLVALAMGATIQLARTGLDGRAPPLAVLVLCAAVGAVSYGAGLAMLNPHAVGEAWAGLRRRLDPAMAR